MNEEPRYWFPAKRYGWGWGLPTAWQGWAIFAAYFALVGAGALFLLPSRGPIVFVLYCIALSLVLVAICWSKGEPPRWRWGPK
jgi:hypothetical protein